MEREKEAIRYWQSSDPDYIDLLMRCYWEQDRAERVRLYSELVEATTAPVGFEWNEGIQTSFCRLQLR